MKMKVQQMLDAVDVLRVLRDKTMPPRAAYWVSRLLAKLQVDWKTAEEKRRELVKKHGVEDDKKNIVVPKDKVLAFLEEWRPIAEEEIELDVQPIRLEVFGAFEISPSIFDALGELVVDETVAA